MTAVLDYQRVRYGKVSLERTGLRRAGCGAVPVYRAGQAGRRGAGRAGGRTRQDRRWERGEGGHLLGIGSLVDTKTSCARLPLDVAHLFNRSSLPPLPAHRMMI